MHRNSEHVGPSLRDAVPVKTAVLKLIMASRFSRARVYLLEYMARREVASATEGEKDRQSRYCNCSNIVFDIHFGDA